MESRKQKNIKMVERAGVWTLFITLFLISFPRTWSLYSLGLFLTIGFILWVLDFSIYLRSLLKIWFLVLPTVLYFLIHLLSIILERAELSFLEDRLMFLAIPLLGYPVFKSEYSRSKLSLLISGFFLGLIFVSVFLIIRLVINVYLNYDGITPFFDWLRIHQQDYSSIGFSVLEHPTYLAMKINWALLLLLYFNFYHQKLKISSFLIILLFTFTLFLIASKAGIMLWFIIVIISYFKRLKSVSNPFIYIIILPAFIFFTIVSVREIQRIERFMTAVKSDFGKGFTDWKNIDQRTREWYSSIQIIKEKPLFGTGLSKVRDTLVKEYLRNNFKDEAELKMNSHNQFLEAQLTFGIFGSISLLFLLLTPICFRKKLLYSDLITGFVIIISFFLLIECLFNRQWGIMFFLLFYFILILPYSSPEVRKL
jgi:O-antigen ligase